MGRIKKAIPLITIETAVALMLLSRFVHLSPIYSVWDLLYLVKYAVALITMYIIMRDKKSIVIGIIGIAYVIISGCFLLHYIFYNFDLETSLLEPFFLFFDPLIIYLTFTAVFICFIAEKGNKYFLFFLVLAVTAADLIVGSVYYLNTIHLQENYGKAEALFLEVANTDFYFEWVVTCLVFVVETILIIVFAKASGKNKSEETKDLKEKEKNNKLPTLLITASISLLLSFLLCFAVLRPIMKSCSYENYKNSFAHKTFEWFPSALDKVSKVSNEKVMSECPFETKESEWTFYPEENITGLVGVNKAEGESENTIILAFADLNSAKDIKNTIINCKYVSGIAKYAGFEYDNRDIREKKQYYYVKLVYDNRIVDPKTISFDKDDERVNIDLSEDNVKLNYCNFGDETIVRKYQNYDAVNGIWNDITNEEEQTPPVSDIPYVQWTELQVDNRDSRYEPLPEGINLFVNEYRFDWDRYDLYGVIQTPQITKIDFQIRNCGVNIDGETVIEDVDESELNIQNGEIKLYVKENGSFKDITPSDATVTSYYATDTIVNYTLESNLLGELEEGDYKLEYAGYSSEFSLAIQTFEAW